MISRFAENASHIAKLRRSLQGQVRGAKELSSDLGRGCGPTTAELRSNNQGSAANGQEFAWVSINEAHKSTSLATSMKRLSWITFIFLPAMFAASLFGMNVDILENNPDWRWYLLFVGSILLLTITGWLFSKYFEAERWVEAHIGRRIQMFTGQAKHSGRRTSNILDNIESSHC
ncbi:hypothetical protein FSARC_14045 [Fusarium sarcochroum]|uniref:Uncharacterized protein n=1 Tax=Fusarium sarcochroum TaxID=1208366 RepID=A0A8H4SWY7_9HYPO|nr:hypothetical protein FSARC_14045 [Fusarium sarcochroum]